MSASKIKNRTPKITVAVDTGGTFTDFYLLTPQGPLTTKVPSTPDDPSRAITEGLRNLKLEDFELIHGTTVATNTLLTGKGSRVALITTKGFEDVIEIGRQNRPNLYHFEIHRPPALVRASSRIGISERISADGKTLENLDRNALKKILKKLRSEKIESIAVCFLFSFKNPRHEEKMAHALRSLKTPLSLSSHICPEYREYERFSTTCVNAFVAPVMSGYLGRLKKRLPQKMRIMQSNGGSLSVSEASDQAVRTLLSGPAGGALGALRVGKESGFSRLLSLDIGGTSTDLALLDGEIELTSEGNVGAYPVKTPMIRIHTIGAGGGSIARLDAGGALRVGPESAGAEPGPIAYGRGGKNLTVTDAHVALGRIPPEAFLGGRLPLFPGKISRPLRRLAAQMKMKPLEAAEGIVQVANSNIVRAMRVISLERGYDPRNFTLIALGGAGPLHACELAESLDLKTVLIPHDPGLLSAYGMAHADWVRDYVQTILVKHERAPLSFLRKKFGGLEKKALADASRDGFSPKDLLWKYQLDLRYLGQSYELTVDFSPRFPRLFTELHRRQFGYVHEGRPLEIVNLRLQARVPSPASLSQRKRQKQKSRMSLKAEKTAPLFWGGRFLKASLYRREKIDPSCKIQGPAVIVEYSATTFIPPGWRIRCDENKNLVVQK